MGTMGGGNGQKSAAKREKNAQKAAKNKKKTSNLKALKNNPQLQCKRCFCTFGATTQKPELEKHCNNKHKTPKIHDFNFSFPDFGKKVEVQVSKFKPDAAPKKKKKNLRGECNNFITSYQG